MPPPDNNDFHARIRVLEEWRTETRDLLHQILNKVEALSNQLATKTSQPCPAPGSCITLAKDVDELRAEHADTMKRVYKLEIASVFLSGSAAAVAVVWAVFKVFLPWMVAM